MNINQFIKFRREVKKISQEFMAYELGISQSQYSRRENGTLKFSLEETIKITKILDFALTELIESNIEDNKEAEITESEKPTLHERLIDQYEARLREKDELIKLLQKKIN